MDSTGFVVNFLSMGEKHAPISLGKNQTMRSVGKVSWSKYFELLARTDVMFSLQESPHPSHPPLDSVASGAFSVTNEMGGTRAGLSPRLFAVDTDPDALGAAVVSAARTATEEGHLDHLDQEFVERLGTPLHGAVSATLKSIF